MGKIVIFTERTPGGTVLMGISMNQPLQTKDNFQAFIDWANHSKDENHLKKIIFVLSDYLHRHNVQLTHPYLSSTEVEKVVKALGDHWCKENENILNNLKIPYELIRWENLINSSNSDRSFNKFLEIVNKDYEEDVEFKGIIDSLANCFSDRLKEKLLAEDITISKKECFNASKNYLLEESAIIFKFIELDANWMTYPGKCNHGLKYVYNKHIEKMGKRLPFFGYKCRKIQAEPDNTNSKLKGKKRLPKKEDPREEYICRELVPFFLNSLKNMELTLEELKILRVELGKFLEGT